MSKAPKPKKAKAPKPKKKAAASASVADSSVADPVLDAVASKAPQGGSHSVAMDFNLAEDQDAAAAAAMEESKKTSKKKKGRPPKKGKTEETGAPSELDPEAIELLDPDAVRIIVGVVSGGLRERSPRWAPTKKEELSFVVAFNKLIDKYIPDDVGKWSPELIFLFVGLTYAVPRVGDLIADRRKKKSETEKKDSSAADRAPDTDHSPGIDPGTVGVNDPRLGVSGE